MRQLAREPRIAELPPFQLKPTEFERSRQAERLIPPSEPELPPTFEPRLPDRGYDRNQDRNQDRSPERSQDRIPDRSQDHVHTRPPDRVPDRIEPAANLTGDRPAEERVDRSLSGHKFAEPIFSARQSRTLSLGDREHDKELDREERQHPRRAPWAVLAWTGWAVAAGCSFVAGLQLHQRQQMQGVLATQQAKMDDVQKQMSHAQQAQEALSTLTAADAMQVALHAAPPLKPVAAVKGAPPAAAPEALAAYLADKGALIFVATHLQPAPAGKTYELWLLPANGQSPVPAGTFKPDAQGSASVLMPKLPKGVPAKGFGVTIENDGGSPTPTLPIVMS
jgi:hypothetical protein